MAARAARGASGDRFFRLGPAPLAPRVEPRIAPQAARGARRRAAAAGGRAAARSRSRTWGCASRRSRSSSSGSARCCGAGGAFDFDAGGRRAVAGRAGGRVPRAARAAQGGRDRDRAGGAVRADPDRAPRRNASTRKETARGTPAPPDHRRARSTGSPGRSRRCSSSRRSRCRSEELGEAADDDAERVETALELLARALRARAAAGSSSSTSPAATRSAPRARRRRRARGCSSGRSSAGSPQAALETLAVIAYLGPVLAARTIARIRGVAADSVVAGLVERGLIAESGRDEGAAARSATARRRCSSGSSGSRACRRCRGWTTSATTRARSATGSRRSPPPPGLIASRPEPLSV